MAGFAVSDAMRGIRELDVFLVVQGCHRIAEVDVANVECLARMDRVDVGVDRPGLHFQVRATTLGDVAQPADNDIPTSVRRMVVCRQRVMAVLATIRDLDDGAVKVVGKCIGSKIKGPGGSVECEGDLIGILQSWHNRDFYSLDGAIRDQISGLLSDQT